MSDIKPKFFMDRYRSDIVRRDVVVWRFRDDAGVWHSGTAADREGAVAQARAHGYKGD